MGFGSRSSSRDREYAVDEGDTVQSEEDEELALIKSPSQEYPHETLFLLLHAIPLPPPLCMRGGVYSPEGRIFGGHSMAVLPVCREYLSLVPFAHRHSRSGRGPLLINEHFSAIPTVRKKVDG